MNGCECQLILLGNKKKKKKEWKELICNESLQRSYKEWVGEECPRAAANTMLQWDLSWHFWQHSCTQFTFHWNQWEVVIPGKAAHQLGLRRNDCRKCQAPVWHPAVYLSSPSLSLFSGKEWCYYIVITMLAKCKSCCNTVLFALLVLSVVSQVNVTAVFHFPRYALFRGWQCYFNSFLLSHTSSRTHLQEKNMLC